MISIHFLEKKDCQTIYEQLRRYIDQYKRLDLQGNISCQDEKIITIHPLSEACFFYESIKPLLVSLLTNHVIMTKEEQWLLEIIESIFYFKDPEEQNQILTIARSMMEGDRDDIPGLHKFLDRERVIYKAFSACVLEDSMFYYDPFLMFRLKEYNEMLIDCVEIAIDEYMLEQEYQNMVEGFRYFIKSQSPKVDTIHLVHDQGYQFYDQSYQKLELEEIASLLEEKLIFEYDLPLEEMVISPLVSISPKKIYIYTKNIDDSVIQTVQAVFQERVILQHPQLFMRLKYKRLLP